MNDRRLLRILQLQYGSQPVNRAALVGRTEHAPRIAQRFEDVLAQFQPHILLDPTDIPIHVPHRIGVDLTGDLPNRFEGCFGIDECQSNRRIRGIGQVGKR